MAIEYKSIFEMQPVTKLLESDRFLVARGNMTWYSTKSSTYANLSSDLADVLSKIQFDLKIIDDRNALIGAGSKTVASARVTGLIDNDLTLVKQNYISQAEDQVISKSWDFTKIPTYSGGYTTSTPDQALATIGKVNQMMNQVEKPMLYNSSFTTFPSNGLRIDLSSMIPFERRKDCITIWFSTYRYEGSGSVTPKFDISNAISANIIKKIRICGTEKIAASNKKLTSYQQQYAQLSGLNDESIFNLATIRIFGGQGTTLTIYDGLIDFSIKGTV